jgi:DNA repair protein RadC
VLLAPLHDDPKGLATRLLYRFGSIGRIVQASECELRQAAQAGESWAELLLNTRRLMQDGMRETLVRTRIGENRQALINYLILTMRNLREERILAIFADPDGYVISEELIAQGDGLQVLLNPRTIFGRAFSLDAHRILLAHNHPSGNASPSLSDIEHTRRLCRQAADLGLKIDDHLVVGAHEVTSMKERGLF